MKHFEGLRKWGKKLEIKFFDKWLIPLDHVTFVFNNSQVLYIFHIDDNKDSRLWVLKLFHKGPQNLPGIKYTTPYHPACNGPCERFNGVLKEMLKRMCDEKPSDGDRYVNPSLFAYRETPKESTGFSPFELLHGSNVRGPLAILKELWTRWSWESQRQRQLMRTHQVQQTCSVKLTYIEEWRY